MPQCPHCMGDQFIVLNGYYFCEQCHIQSQECAEEDVEEDFYEGGLSGRLEIRTKKSKDKNKDYGRKWTTFDAFNFILKKQVDALLVLGASPELKPVVLQLWVNYLHNLRVAFIKKPGNQVKLQVNLRTRDLYMLSANGSKIPSMRTQSKKRLLKKRQNYRKAKLPVKEPPVKRKKLRMGGSELSSESEFEDASSMSSNISSCSSVQSDESDVENVSYYDLVSKRVIRSRKKNRRCKNAVRCMSLSRTISFIYLGLLLLNEQILLCDLIRWAWEGLIPYYSAAVDVLPDDVQFQTYDNATFKAHYPLSNGRVRKEAGQLAAFLQIQELPRKSIQYVAMRFIKELELPAVMHSYVNNLVSIYPPKMSWVYNPRKRMVASIPNYEGRAIAFIIVALKLLFGLNDIDEWKTSAYAEKLRENNLHKMFGESVPFVWRDWIKQLSIRFELQLTVWQRANRRNKFERPVDIESLASFYANEGNSWRGRFNMNRLASRRSESDEIWSALCQPFRMLLRDTINIMKPAEIMPSSFPLLSETKDIPSNLNTYFCDTSLDYLMSTDCLQNHKSDVEADENEQRVKRLRKKYRKFFKSCKRYYLNRSLMTCDRDAMACIVNPLSCSFLRLLKMMAAIVEMEPGVLFKEINLIERILLRKNEDNRGRNIVENLW